MIEPIEATVKLPCTLRCGRKARREAEGFTEIVARDSAVIRVATDIASKWLTPHRAVTLAIQLPARRGVMPRKLACGALVRNIRRLGSDARVELDIRWMEFNADRD